MRLTSNPHCAFAVHCVLHVVAEFLDVACRTVHICNLFHVDDHVVLVQPFVWTNSAQLTRLFIVPVH